MENGFLDEKELSKLGFSSIGENVKIDRTAIFYGASRISIGSNSRIDAYSVLSAGGGGIFIGNHVHVGVYAFLSGAARIELHDFISLSGKVTIYSSNDDYSGEGMTGPTVPENLRNVYSAPVIIGKHAVVGAGSIVLPGIEIGEGACIGSLSLVKRSVPPFIIAAGVPAKPIGKRKKDFLQLEQFVDEDL